MLEGDYSDRCYICGRYGPTEVHHCLHGIRRAEADKYGLTVHLCRICHARLHDRGDFDRELERTAQREYEKKYGHEKWMEIFGKDYEGISESDG